MASLRLTHRMAALTLSRPTSAPISPVSAYLSSTSGGKETDNRKRCWTQPEAARYFTSSFSSAHRVTPISAIIQASAPPSTTINSSQPLLLVDAVRNFSSAAAATTDLNNAQQPPPVFTSDDGKKYPLFTAPNPRTRTRIKPSLIYRRINKLRTYEGSHKKIRHSPWRLNLVCQFAAGQTVPDALKQLQFCEKSRAPLVAALIRKTSNLADIRDGLQRSQLEVAECFATHGSHLKRHQFMARGRTGKKHRRFSHVRLVLREIDFPLKVALAKSFNQKKRWVLRQQVAEQDAAKAKAEREEIALLERKAEERKANEAEEKK